MSPDQLAARSRATGAGNERTVLAVLAAAGAAGVRPGRDLADLTGLAQRTLTAVVARLEERGLAKRDGKRRVWATDAGRGEAGAGAPGVWVAPALDAAIGCFPTEAQRAFVRLQLAAVIARWHLADEYSTGWPGFIAIGDSKTGKTAVASLVAHVYGLSELQTIRSAFRETPGSLVGRRERDGQSATGWRVERSPALALPYICIDEWPRASRELQAAAGGLLLGATADELEGERFELRPTVYVTLDTARGLEGPRPRLRAQILRARYHAAASPACPISMSRCGGCSRRADGIPRLRLERLRPPCRRSRPNCGSCCGPSCARA